MNVPASNEEQLLAEFMAGCHVHGDYRISRTHAAYLVMACQAAMKRPDVTDLAFAVLKDLVRSFEEQAGFQPETRRLINAGWQ